MLKKIEVTEDGEVLIYRSKNENPLMWVDSVEEDQTPNDWYITEEGLTEQEKKVIEEMGTRWNEVGEVLRKEDLVVYLRLEWTEEEGVSLCLVQSFTFSGEARSEKDRVIPRIQALQAEDPSWKFSDLNDDEDKGGDVEEYGILVPLTAENAVEQVKKMNNLLDGPYQDLKQWIVDIV